MGLINHLYLQDIRGSSWWQILSTVVDLAGPACREKSL